MPAAIVILGHTELVCDGRPAGLRRQLRKALALMVAARGRRVRREEIAAAVWDDDDRDVRTLMWSLRRTLRDTASGFDVPPDKSKDGSYRLVAVGADSLEETVDAFRFLALTRAAEKLRDDGDERAATQALTAAAALWDGEPFAGLWPEGAPEACRRLAAELERARELLVAGLAEAALSQGAPYDPARRYLGRPVGAPADDPVKNWRDPGGADRVPGGDAAWLAGFLVALHDGPGTEEAERLLAARHSAAQHSAAQHGATQHGAAQYRAAGDGIAAWAGDLLVLAQSGIDVHRALTVAPSPPVAGSPAVLVGRDAELAAFQRMVAAVAGHQPAVLAVRGAAGRGKTRLAAAFTAAAAAAGVPVVALSGAAPGDLRPWQELAGRLWPAACRDAAAGRGSGFDRTAGQLTLGQRRALLDFVAPRGAGGDAPEPDQAQSLRFAEIARALALLAGLIAVRRGLIVTLDDADQLTARGRELLALLLASLRDVPVGLVLLGRDEAEGEAEDEAAAGRPPWTAPVTEARADAAVLRLRPLPEAAIASWLHQVTGRPPGPPEVRLVAGATGGEPARIRGWVTAAAGPLTPAPAEAAVEDDARPPGGPSQPDSAVPSAWLAAAAITATGLVIDTGLVAAMLGLSDAAADQEELRARRLASLDTGAGIRFTDTSQREHVIARLDTDPALRRTLHRRAFEVLAGRVSGGGDPDPVLPVRVAGHARGADRDLPAELAARAFLAAARAERASGEAAETWAREGLGRCATAGDAVEPATRACLHLVLGDALDQRGAVTAADREYELAYDIAVAAPVERAEALIRLARRWTDPGKIDWYLLHGLREAVAALEGRADDQSVALRLQLSGHLARKSTLAVPVIGTDADSIRTDGIALARAALSQADTLPPAAACEVLNECRWALYDYVPPAETAALSQRLERTSLLARSPYFQSQALMTLAIDQLRLGRVTDAQSTLLAHERTMPPSHANQWLQLTMETVLDLWFGRLAAAEARLADVAWPIVAQAHAGQERVADTLQQTWQGQVFWLRRERGGRLRKTDPDVARQIEGHAFFPIWQAGLALLSADEGDLGTAAAHVLALDADSHGFAAYPPHGWTPSVAALLAETLVALSPAGRPRVHADPLGGRLPEVAGRLRAVLDQHAGEFVLGGWPSVLLGPAGRFSGLLALATGQYEEALQLFDAASGLVATAPPQAARLQVSKARGLIRRAQAAGRRSGLGEAARLLAEASATADRVGLGGLSAEAAALLAEC